MSDNPAKIAELQNDKLIEILRSKNLGVPVCRHIESKGHNGQQFVKPEYVIETFPSVEFLRSIKLLKMQIRSLVSVRKELHVETSAVPYLEIHNSNSNTSSASAAASSSPSITILTAEDEKVPYLETSNDNNINNNNNNNNNNNIASAAPSSSASKTTTSVSAEEAAGLYSKVVDGISFLYSMVVPSYLETSNDNNANNSAAASSSPSKTTTTSAAEEAEKLLQEAAPLFSSGKYSEAVDLYSKVIDSTSSKEAEADASLKMILSCGLADRSGCFVKLKKLKAALDDARRCADVRPSWIRAHLRVAEAAEELNKIDLAISAYESAMKAEDQSGNVPSQKELESKILSVQRAQFRRLMGKIGQSAVSPVSIRDTLISAAKYCTSSESARSFCGSIANLVVNETNKVLFGTASVRDALVAVSNNCTTPESADFFCYSIRILAANNEANQVLFGVASVRDSIVVVSKSCATPQSAHSFCNTINNLAYNANNRIVFGTTSVRDALVAVSKYCTAANSAYSFCSSIFNFTFKNEANRVLFGTASVRDAIVAVSKYCSATVSADSFCLSILNLTANDNNKILFGTPAVRDAILSASAFIDVHCGVYRCCRVISLFLETNPTLFCVEKTVRSLVKLSQLQMIYQSPESIYWFLNVALTLLHSNQKLFDTSEIRVAVVRFQEVVNDPGRVAKLKTETIDKMSNEEYLDKARQLCVEFRGNVSGKSEASCSSSSVVAVINNKNNNNNNDNNNNNKQNLSLLHSYQIRSSADAAASCVD